jgi:glycosyltransferase involved in cell wall biosynthesis
MQKVTVVHIVPDLRQQAGGIAATVPALAEALRAQNVDCRFITYAHDHDFAWARQTTCGPRFNAQNPGKLGRVIEGVLAGLPSGAPVVMHSHGLWDMLNHASMQTAARLQRPTVLSVHGMLLPWARQNKRLRKDMAWALYQRRDLLRASKLHVTSRAEQKIVAGIAGAQAVAEIPFGVDLPTLPAPTEGSDKTLLFLGRLHRVKNLEALINAFVEVAPEGWALRLVGPDEEGHRAKLEALVAELGAHHLVSFAGPAYGPEKERELARARALVLPSFSENFGAVVAEALAMGRPVIASRGTPWQALDDARCGWWVPPEQSSLARAIDQLARTPPDMLAQMGARGRELVTRAFSWESSGRAMAQLYEDLTASDGDQPKTH